MPRTRSTAALQACLRQQKYMEPFSEYRIFNVNLPKNKIGDPKKFSKKYEASIHNTLRKINDVYATLISEVPSEKITELISELNRSDTVSKIFGFHLTSFLPGRKWFFDCDKNSTHDIFVLTRDLREQIFSYLLAPKFGFFEKEKIEPHSIAIDESSFSYCRSNIDSFLRFFPKNATLVTWETLPISHFDKSKVEIREQNSLENLSFIENLDECEWHIENLIKYYADEWNEKLASIPKAV